jgi:hypothetical protein
VIRDTRHASRRIGGADARAGARETEGCVVRTPWARLVLAPERMRTIVTGLLRSRAVHFALIGTAIFAIAPRREDPSRVAISSGDLDALHAMQASRLGVASLSAAQADEVDERAIEDDVLYREALRLGLDRGDNVVRQHLVQKTLLLAEDMAGATRTPTEADLRAYYEATRTRWRRDSSVRFLHVFAGRREAITSLTAVVRDAERTSPATEPPPVGDAFPASRDVTSKRSAVAAVYGEPFASSVFAQPLGSWGEPVESKLGWHLVKVVSRDEGRQATFEEARAALLLEWAVDQRHRAIAAFLAHAFDRYDVTVDGVPRTRAARLPRLARRLDPSGED